MCDWVVRLWSLRLVVSGDSMCADGFSDTNVLCVCEFVLRVHVHRRNLFRAIAKRLFFIRSASDVRYSPYIREPHAGTSHHHRNHMRTPAAKHVGPNRSAIILYECVRLQFVCAHLANNCGALLAN